MKFFEAVLFVCLLSLCVCSLGWAIDITSTGNWAETINAGDLVGGAGTDLNDQYTSASDQVAITISNTLDDNDNWRVDVRKSDTSWHNDLSVSVKRTDGGSGTGAISGGTSFQTAGAVDAEFFNGRGDRSNVHVQLQVSGMSVSIPPATYSTSIVFTVVDTL